jgi:hypothetical protein
MELTQELLTNILRNMHFLWIKIHLAPAGELCKHLLVLRLRQNVTKHYVNVTSRDMAMRPIFRYHR